MPHFVTFDDGLSYMPNSEIESFGYDREETNKGGRWIKLRGRPYGTRRREFHGPVLRDNLTRLLGLIGMRCLLPLRSADGFRAEVPFTFVAVAPRNIPGETDFDAFNALISRSEFVIRFDDGMLLDGKNTLSVSGFFLLPEPQALV